MAIRKTRRAIIDGCLTVSGVVLSKHHLLWWRNTARAHLSGLADRCASFTEPDRVEHGHLADDCYAVFL